MFGWCADRKHNDCQPEYNVFYFDPKGKIVITDETRYCDCKCHGKDKK